MAINSSFARISAFAESTDGGNPAGVWLGDSLPSAARMQSIAASVAYSETVFIAPQHGCKRQLRYFSKQHEVAFCGHATIAAGFFLASVSDVREFEFDTQAGTVPVQVTEQDGEFRVTLRSVTPTFRLPNADQLAEYLDALEWSAKELDQEIVPALAFAGAWHLILAAATTTRLENLQYRRERLTALMQRDELTTLQLIWRADAREFHSRNPFPVGGVYEDPATGAAAAALGGYLRDARLISAPTQLIIRQGEVMGQPSRLYVDVPATGGIRVSGTARVIAPQSGDSAFLE